MSSLQYQSWQFLADQLGQLGHRRLVLVEGDREWALAWLRDVLPKSGLQPGVWTGPKEESPAEGLVFVAPGKARSWLGRELGVVVWDGWKGNPPDGIAALAGTLKAGGLLFWLMPPLAQWAQFEDPDYRRTGLDGVDEHPFAARLARILNEAPGVIRVSPGQEGGPGLPGPASGPSFEPGETAEQKALVAELVRFGLGRRRRPLVVTADRGRGKSAALGLAAAELLLAGRQQVVVTAPSPESVQALFRHAAQRLGDQLEAQGEAELCTQGGHWLQFLPVQQLLEERPQAEVVMVDEAAAIPAHWLREVLLGWPRVAFASTVHGYEGAGRGFAIRFRAVLDRETPHWRQVTLKQPIRWADGDPLEALIFRLYLLAAEGPSLDGVALGDVVIEPWSPAEATEAELSEAFGLLVDAHYRTTPADLRQWLDDPAAQSWRAVSRGKAVGVLWASAEGGLPDELAVKVSRGERRVRGHMLAQSLATHGGFPEAASQRYLRVVRVAVSEQARGLGVGKRLVKAAEGACKEQSLDALGTSFGGDPGLLAFWQSCGFQVVRCGLQQEASTGEYPLQMLNGVSPEGEALGHRLRRRFARHWPVLVPRNWPGMAPDLLAAITVDLPATGEPDADDLRDLQSFAEGFRGFELTLPLLREAASYPGLMAWMSGQPDRDLWCRAVLQGWSWHRLRMQGLCTGQKDGEARLRELVQDRFMGSFESSHTG